MKRRGNRHHFHVSHASKSHMNLEFEFENAKSGNTKRHVPFHIGVRYFGIYVSLGIKSFMLKVLTWE
jgi:hypothetical protein